MKIRLLLGVIAAAILMMILTAGVLAQDTEVPPPYAGRTNPFPWDDAQAQQAGKEIYQRSCIGCHGTTGAGVTSADFSAAAWQKQLEQKPDYSLWRLADGLISQGMPPFKSSLSEEQHWQVLTYLWLLGEAVPAAPLSESGAVFPTTLQLAAPAMAEAGEPLTLRASLRDLQGNPVRGETVNFYVLKDFFTSAPMKIGEAITDRDGIATLEYIPRHFGDMTVGASFGASEAQTTMEMPDTDRIFYRTEVGIKVPTLGEARFIGPERLKLEEEGFAPPTVFRLPSGTLFWLAPILLVAMIIWVVYFYNLYQVYRIPLARSGAGTDTRRVPLIGLIIIALLGAMLVLMLITSPLSHPA
ncbi:MAG: hypothetical protein C4555_05435 [Dehalococcoidia bacterium]|nr:MAG: hypothetical protein C4555_05435 [Dehalococcoidia bacterium]